jgi:hypothetical protein
MNVEVPMGNGGNMIVNGVPGPWVPVYCPFPFQVDANCPSPVYCEEWGKSGESKEIKCEERGGGEWPGWKMEDGRLAATPSGLMDMAGRGIGTLNRGSGNGEWGKIEGK